MRLRRGRVGPAPPLGGYCALPRPPNGPLRPAAPGARFLPHPQRPSAGSLPPARAPASRLRPRRPHPATGPRTPSPPQVFSFARPPHRAFSSGLGAAVCASRPALRSAPYPAPHRPRRPAPASPAGHVTAARPRRLRVREPQGDRRLRTHCPRSELVPDAKLICILCSAPSTRKKTRRFRKGVL